MFCYSAFVHIPKDEKSKLDKRFKNYVFVGYGHGDFGYKLLNLVDRKIIRSYDVISFEDQTIEDSGKIEKSKSDARSYIDVMPKSPS